jgi:hypothetical protein
MGIQPGQNGAEPHPKPPPIDVERHLERDVRELLAAIERLSNDAAISLRDHLDRRPYPSLGVGLLAGYVLGGGLTFRLGTFVAAAAWRAGLASVLSSSRATASE